MYLQAKDNAHIRKKNAPPCLVEDIGGNNFALEVLLCIGFYKSFVLSKVQIDPIHAFKNNAWLSNVVQETLGTQVNSCLLSLSGICYRSCVFSSSQDYNVHVHGNKLT